MTWNRTVREWNSTLEERERVYACDTVLPDHNDAYFRALTVSATPSTVFRWLCQMRVAPYSYDWIDNRGRRSPRELSDGVEILEPGQRFMSVFGLVSFEQDAHLTLELASPGRFPPLAISYCVLDSGDATSRLVVKLVVQYGPGLFDRVTRLSLPTLDWIMMRKQLLNMKALAEAT